MNISYADNGWTVFINENLNDLSDQEIIEIGKLVVKNMVVVFKNQKLTPEQELNFCSKIGKYQYYPPDVERIKHIRVNDGILRVTGKKNEYGEEGLFGHKAALDWHANQPSNKQRSPLIWLYGVEGTKGSRTSWINNIRSYEDLPSDIKEKINNIKVYCGYKVGSYSNSRFFIEHIDKDNPVNLVQINKEGNKGLFFPFLQIFGFENYEEKEFKEIMNLLTDHILQEKYVYHHDWEDGDIVISEQWLSIHKRWPFEDMANRVLHRIAFDYSKIYTD
jgi:taurine dioxygenase